MEAAAVTRAGAPEGPQQAPAPTSQHNLMPGPGMPWMPWMSFPFCMPPGMMMPPPPGMMMPPPFMAMGPFGPVPGLPMAPFGCAPVCVPAVGCGGVASAAAAEPQTTAVGGAAEPPSSSCNEAQGFDFSARRRASSKAPKAPAAACAAAAPAAPCRRSMDSCQSEGDAIELALMAEDIGAELAVLETDFSGMDEELEALIELPDASCFSLPKGTACGSPMSGASSCRTPALPRPMSRNGSLVSSASAFDLGVAAAAGRASPARLAPTRSHRRSVADAVPRKAGGLTLKRSGPTKKQAAAAKQHVANVATMLAAGPTADDVDDVLSLGRLPLASEDVGDLLRFDFDLGGASSYSHDDGGAGAPPSAPGGSGQLAGSCGDLVMMAGLAGEDDVSMGTSMWADGCLLGV